MALTEIFPPEHSMIINRPGRKTDMARALIPITARALVEWTYAVQIPHRGGSAIAGGANISQTGLVIERLLLGCTVDRNGGGAAPCWGVMHCDEDALTVHGIAEGLRPRDRRLLISYAELRSTPDWNPLIMPLRCVPVPGRKGQPKGIYAHHGKTQIGCEISYEGDWPSRAMADRIRAAWPEAPRLRCADEIIAHARQAYQQWYEALWALCDGLEAAGRRGLRRYRIQGLGAVYEPWRV